MGERSPSSFEPSRDRPDACAFCGAHPSFHVWRCATCSKRLRKLDAFGAPVELCHGVAVQRCPRAVEQHKNPRVSSGQKARFVELDEPPAFGFDGWEPSAPRMPAGEPPASGGAKAPRRRR